MWQWVGTFLGIAVFRVGLLAGGVFLLQRTAWARRRRVYAVEPFPGQYRSEVLAGLVVIAYDAALIPSLQRSGLTERHPFHLGWLLVGLALGFIFNEVWFYLSHRLLHLKPLYFIHAQHHVARVVDPLSSVSFSLAEHVIGSTPTFFFVFSMSLVLPVPPEAGLLFGLLTEAGNVYGHSNIEVWRAGFPDTALGHVVGTPTFHAMHHARYNGHYGLYTRVLDRLFGTEWTDYGALQARAASNQPLPSLSTREVTAPAAQASTVTP